MRRINHKRVKDRSWEISEEARQETSGLDHDSGSGRTGL